MRKGQRRNEEIMKNIAFVLLHYNNMDVTRCAVNYICRLNTQDLHVFTVIVDNASPNGSGRKLEEEYSNSRDVFVLCNESNLGFAKGNNIGYQFAKQQCDCSFIIVMNSDVYIQDVDFLQKIISRKEKVELLAPDIITKNGSHQNPFRMQTISNRSLQSLCKYNYLMYHLYCHLLTGIFAISVLAVKHKMCRKKDGMYQKEKRDIVPHGACVIFTESWIEKEEFAFVPITFMYMEEDVLVEYIRQKNYHTLFCPELKVFHIEDASLEDSFQSCLRKRKFLAKNMYLSSSQLIKMRKRNKKKK